MGDMPAAISAAVIAPVYATRPGQAQAGALGGRGLGGVESPRADSKSDRELGSSTYHHERTHQGLGNRLIEDVPEPRWGRIARRERLGGILNHYYREVA